MQKKAVGDREVTLTELFLDSHKKKATDTFVDDRSRFTYVSKVVF